MVIPTKRAHLLMLGLLGGMMISAKGLSYKPDVDVQHYLFSLTLSDTSNMIRGTADVTVRFLRDAIWLRLDLDGKKGQDTGMTAWSVRENGIDLSYEQDGASILVHTKAGAGSLHTYTVQYGGIPRDGLIISSNKFGKRTFFGDNWPNRAHDWLPCIDHPSDKAPVDFIVTAPDHYQVVSNGLKIEDTLLEGHLRRTHWQEKVPLATKVMVIGVADFAVDHPGNVGDIPVYSYVFPENREQGFHDYAMAMGILPYYIRTIGPFAFEKLANIQSKTIFGGMENASAIFYYENSVGARGVEELMAHEIAHQWFGDAVTETQWQHLWLSEGFATYMTHLYMENKYGTDTLKAGLSADRIKVIAFAAERQIPVVDTTVKGQYMKLLNANSYQKGGWVLHMLRRKLGDTLFWRGIDKYFALYNGRNANTDDFEKVMEGVSGQNLRLFFKQWLYTPGLPVLQVSRTYDASKALLTIQVTQEQGHLFSFPLEYSLGNDPKIYRVNIRDKTTLVHLSLSSRPDTVKMDPQVNLLADFH